MSVTVFSFAMSVLFSVLFILAIHLLRNQPAFLSSFGVHTILGIYALCLFRTVAVIELPFTVPFDMGDTYSAVFRAVWETYIPLEDSNVRLLYAICGIWAVVTATLIVQFLWKSWKVSRKAKWYSTNRDSRAEQVLEQVKSEFRRMPAVKVCICPTLDIPMGSGLFRHYILEHWCEYLIEQYKLQEERWKKSKKERKQALIRRGRENEISQRNISEIFSDDINEIISLILLFYQNVPADLFREFLQPYQEYITKSELFLDQETFTVENLWDERAVFRWKGKLLIANTDEEKKAEDADEEINVLYMKDETIRRLPHRLIHIESVSAKKDGEMSYSFRLGHSSKETPNRIQMDKLAQQLDCFSIMNSDANSIPNWFQLVRAVFKPNAKYPHLLVPKFPKTFKIRNNFSLLIDHCIRWYILSPFDEDFIRRYKREIQKVPYNKTFILKAVEEHFRRSTYAKNCVEYVYKQTNSRCYAEEHLKESELKEIILREYTAFMAETCSLIVDGDGPNSM